MKINMKYDFKINTPIFHGEKFGVNGEAVGLSLYKLQEIASSKKEIVEVFIKYKGHATVLLDDLRSYTKGNPLSKTKAKGTPLRVFPISIFTFKEF